MDIKKKITFICTDKAEKQQFQPISEEAKKRGYKIRFTDNVLIKCDIGFYCQHICFPKNSKLSIVTLHDIGQAHGLWPNIWFKEPWNEFDIGVLPGKTWTHMWQESSKYYYANPRIGVFQIGWPKADIIKKTEFLTNKEKTIKEIGIDIRKKSVLYAPSWENNSKQDDFVQSLIDKDVNILIKQAWYDPKLYPHILKNIDEMNHLHKNLKNVHIIDPSVNIFDAIALCDLLVSDESSTMFEAMLMGIPSISVSNWLIPDINPPRFTCNPYEFVIKTNKENLEQTIEETLINYEYHKNNVIKYRDNNFDNIGKTSPLIMDIIDAVVEGKNLPIKSLKRAKYVKISFKDYYKNKKARLKSYLTIKYSEKNIFFKMIFSIYKKLKYIIKHNI